MIFLNEVVRNKKYLVSLTSIILTVSLLGGCGTTTTEQPSQEKTQVSGVEKYQRQDVVMGTMTTAVVYSSGEDITPQVMERISKVEDDYISWRVEGSDIAKINESVGNETGVDISEDTAAYLKQSLDISEITQGAFDPTLGKLSRLWDVDGENPKVPETKEIKTLLADSGYEKISLEQTHVTLEKDTSIDLGAVGKGIGCDEAKNLLSENSDVMGGVISVGGSILVYGEKPDGSDWQVAITNPDDDTDYIGVVSLAGENYVSTSGSYEKFFEEDGKRYHHILDPDTGYPAESGLVSVSILTNNGLLSDGLSTACFVLGMEKSLPVLEHYGAEAIFVDENHKVYLTDGMKDKFELTKDGYEYGDISSN